MLIHERTELRENKHVEYNYDLVIVGGGLSGVCCALSAARSGIKVALIQDRPVLGGNASSEVRVWALGATSHMGNNNRWAREGGIIDEIMVENLHRNKEGNPFLFDALLLDKVLSEPLISLYLNTVVIDLIKDTPDKIKGIIAFNPQNQTSYLFNSELFCDASGDGIVGYMSGASYRIGAEDGEEYKEGFSPSKEYGEKLGHTIFFYTKTTDTPIEYIAPDFALKDMESIPKLHQISPSQTGCNYWWFEYGGNMDTIHDSEQIKMELWKIIYGAWNYIKNSGKYPEAEKMTLEWVGVIPGKRESRRFQGLYMLNQNDIVNQTNFHDAIAYGGWAIDLHPAEGIYSSMPSCNQYHSKGIYSIPYRCYVSKDIDNLFFLGRIISVSHIAFGSTRVMITSAFGGQAIGIAAALCHKHKCLPSQMLDDDKMRELQQILNLNGQSIPYLPINESSNLAHDAKISATSSLNFSGFDNNAQWHKLEYSSGILLPLRKNVTYDFEIGINAIDESELIIDLMVSSKKYNYTPDKLIESIIKKVDKGIQILNLKFNNTLEDDQYAFLIFRRNNKIMLPLSNQCITGITTVINKFNKAVNNYGCQTSPENSGFEDFEFFTPERRPNASNYAFKMYPSLTCYDENYLVNGYIKPYLQPNAWVADWNTEEATIAYSWDKLQEINSIRIFFDTDSDHPMETVQWNHPASDCPFCVKEFCIMDENDNVLLEESNNYKTIYDLKLNKTLHTSRLIFKFKRKEKNTPISVFQIEIR